MFERFVRDARVAVVEAQSVAVRQGDAEIEPVHLLQALLAAPESRGGRLLVELGVPANALAERLAAMRRRGGISDADAAALAEFGIDVERIVERVEQVHGENALAGAAPPRGRRWLAKGSHRPFTAEAKEVLERTLAEATELGDTHIGTEHLLLALTARPGPVADILAERGVDHVAIRSALARRAAG
ncbi:Clp amino terminal domain-containing protein, pathogenicity island component [Amycolatopsis arida]|uniref:Clp amino terminal domain-containing protein, pathogenicity island component n=1 Tax=Amycolatopsis arida TaxID=587909 RepID=A0A1I5YCQ5_9PSEU|nr:Clp protease N-terminal domain-containing protein [Amycolatopsis arida]TDX90425.1 ClpA/ClpB-like protein [Amycolatopsis arida]SFQ41968.1 Clp amino terminal domain-containing protein, pathogenicity island component [Amycolatopsis arida]